ncbi:tRNA (cytosine(32)/uridine(32)-2'-O)-methyltransferase TrmJ, partial [Myxococcota bacterium]|nr:tRNA (cytosine(32)/uridine(32)-2'-O)-methyltransferase TrmJ [Myxococcota bacterium]
MIRHNLAVILVEPEHPGNIGSTARAMKTQGIDRLLLVNAIPFSQETWWLAHASEDIVENALHFPTLEEALRGFSRVYATSAKPHQGYNNLAIREAAPVLCELAVTQPVALVFGPERTGLRLNELAMAQGILTIPTLHHYPSLNLSMAVTVLLHELYHGVPSNVLLETPDAPTPEEIHSLADHFLRLIVQAGYTAPDIEAQHQSMR